MIKINYEEKKDKIESIYWSWFKKNHLNNFKEIIKLDKNLDKFIFKGQGNHIKEEESEDYIKNFLISEADKHDQIIRYFTKNTITEKTKTYFLDRYKNFRSTQAPKVVNELNIKTCPYCNRNYLDVYFDAKNKAIRFNGDLDHYFPKEEYPYLAINLYNLVPCCKVCNQEKGKKKEGIFHPYLDDNANLYKFKTEFDKNGNIDYLYGLTDQFELKIEILENPNSQKISASKKLFKLNEKYENQKEYVKNLIKKVYMYNDTILNEFKTEVFNIDDNDTIIFGEEEMKKVVFDCDFNPNEHLDKPLSKLTYDILNEFGVE